MIRSNKELHFWLFFSALNLSLFLPIYLMHIGNSSFIPDFGCVESAGDLLKYLFGRENLDIFRFSLDLLIMTWILLFIRKPGVRRWLKYVFTTLFIVYLFYSIYQGSIHAIYQQWPLFYSDYYLIIEGLKLLMDNSFVWVLLLLIVLALLGLFIRYLFLSFEKYAHIGNLSKKSIGVLLFISACGIGATIDYKHRMGLTTLVFPSHAYWIVENGIRSGVIAESTQNMDPDFFKSYYDYENYELLEKPNVHILFIESYGRILYDDTELFEPFDQRMGDFVTLLENDGWKAASAYSESPTKGGKSWLGFTSMLMGIPVDNHAIYEYLINHYEQDLPTLMGALKDYNYRSYWLSPISDGRKDIPLDKYDNFYSIDTRILFDDLDYQGELYGFLKAPADQYSLNYAKEIIDGTGDQPYVLFSNSINSHSPYHSPVSKVDNWRDLGVIDHELDKKISNSGQQEENLNYAEAMAYQFDYLSDFIVNQGKGNDIFILIGDHQPPFLANTSKSFETPIHIISRDSIFVDGFSPEMTMGYYVDKNVEGLKHEGIFSLFMNNFLNRYGAPGQTFPEYKANGLPLNGEL